MKTITDLEELEEYQLRYLVRKLAEYEEPENIQRELKEVYDLEVPQEIILLMNPVQPGNNVETRWAQYFLAIREHLFHHSVAVAGLFKVDRLKRLHGLLKLAEGKQDIGNILKIHEAIKVETDPIFRDLIRLMKINAGELERENYHA